MLPAEIHMLIDDNGREALGRISEATCYNGINIVFHGCWFNCSSLLTQVVGVKSLCV